MNNLLTVFFIFLLAGCSAEKFAYDRKNACEISYGAKAFSVIADGTKLLVKNNRMDRLSVTFRIKTAQGNYSTMGRYFPDSITTELVADIAASEFVYLEWFANTADSGDGRNNTSKGIVNTSDFSQRLSECINQQKNR